jgi:hypothetical protein
MLRQAGIVLTTMREYYGEAGAQRVGDVEWIALTAQRGWIGFHKRSSSSSVAGSGVAAAVVLSLRQITPRASMASATWMNPAMLAPAT